MEKNQIDNETKTLTVELEANKFIEVAIRDQSLSSKENFFMGKDAEGHEYGGTNGHGHEYGGTNGIGNPRGGRTENVEQFFKENLDLIPEKNASINELLDSRIKAISVTQK